MLNKVTLMGRLGDDPVARYMPSGGAVVNVSIATTRRWKDKQSGERREETEWHRVCFFNRIAEVVAEYLHKGSLVYIEGRIRTRDYEKDGNKRYVTEIIADSMQMLDSKQGYAGGAVTAPSSVSAAKAPASAPQSLDDFDDVPF